MFATPARRGGLEVIPRVPPGWLPVRRFEATTLISLFVVTVLPGDLLSGTGNSPGTLDQRTRPVYWGSSRYSTIVSFYHQRRPVIPPSPERDGPLTGNLWSSERFSPVSETNRHIVKHGLPIDFPLAYAMVTCLAVPSTDDSNGWVIRFKAITDVLFALWAVHDPTKFLAAGAPGFSHGEEAAPPYVERSKQRSLTRPIRVSLLRSAKDTPASRSPSFRAVELAVRRFVQPYPRGRVEPGRNLWRGRSQSAYGRGKAFPACRECPSTVTSPSLQGWGR